MSILIFFLVLFVLILVHEWGHYITARMTGMKVEEFGIGFPPRAFSWQRGEVRWSLNWLPIGGFVKILEENGFEEGTSQADRSRAFGARPKWAQAVVLLAGVTMNVLFAWVLFVAVQMIGVPTAVDETTATDAAQLLVHEVIAGGPAAAQLVPGSIITDVTSGDQTIDRLTPAGLTEFVTQVAPDPIAVTVMLGDQVSTVTIAPEAGLSSDDPDRFLIGIRPVLVEDQSVGLGEAIVRGTTQTIDGLVAITVGLFSLIGQSITGTADYTQVAGPVGIVGMVGDAAAFGIVALLTFTAFISLNLAIINLLPVPALDGGRLVFVFIETITGKTIPAEWAGRVNLIGFALLMFLMVAVTYNDIVRLL